MTQNKEIKEDKKLWLRLQMSALIVISYISFMFMCPLFSTKIPFSYLQQINIYENLPNVYERTECYDILIEHEIKDAFIYSRLDDDLVKALSLPSYVISKNFGKSFYKINETVFNLFPTAFWRIVVLINFWVGSILLILETLFYIILFIVFKKSKALINTVKIFITFLSILIVAIPIILQMQLVGITASGAIYLVVAILTNIPLFSRKKPINA